MASGLSRQVAKIEKSIALLGMLSDQLRFLQPSTRQLIEGVASMAQFEDTGYLINCKKHMHSGQQFPQSWIKGVQDDSANLGKGHAEVLLPLGEVLGSTDLESQLSAIQHARALLENRLEEARGYREKHAKMYQTLGLLGGAAIVILFL